LDPKLTARENLRMAARLFGVPKQEVPSRVAELLAFSELSDRADEPVKRLSGGMRRRLELARALVHEPDLLLMDEPTAGLDERSFQRAWERIEGLRATRGVSVLLTTHRPEEAERCDRVAILDAGCVLAVDPPELLRRRVAGNVIHLEGDDPAGLLAAVQAGFGVTAHLVEHVVVVEAPRGHELVPRLVEGLPKGRLRSL